MGILDKIFGKGDDDKQENRAPTQEEIDAVECPHTAMTPHWESLDDMGKNELATYTCEACGRMFTYAQAKEFMEKPPAVIVAASEESEFHDTNP